MGKLSWFKKGEGNMQRHCSEGECKTAGYEHERHSSGQELTAPATAVAVVWRQL